MSFFSKKYETAGPGIAKDAPKKKGIALFFDIFGRKLWQLMGLNLMYMMFFVPLILILPVISLLKGAYPHSVIAAGILVVIFMVLVGPATAGMTKVIRCFVLEKHTFIWHDFWKGFK